MTPEHAGRPGRRPARRGWGLTAIALAPVCGLSCAGLAAGGGASPALVAGLAACLLALATAGLALLARGPALPAAFGALFLAALWLASPAEQLALASDRDTPGRTQIFAATAGGGGLDRLTAVADDDAPAFSPDRRRLAFIRRGEGRQQLFVADSQGGNPHPFPGTEGQNSHPAWSPDGRWLAFASDRGGDWEIYVAAGDGTQLRNLSQRPGYDDWPTWSPDGRTIAFHFGHGETTGIATVGFAGGPATILVADRPAREPAWAPDGRALAATVGPPGATQICLLGTDGAPLRCLTPPGRNAMPAWSPSGGALAFAVGTPSGSTIAVVPAAGGAPRPLGPRTGVNTAPSWSRGGPAPAILPAWLRRGRW